MVNASPPCATARSISGTTFVIAFRKKDGDVEALSDLVEGLVYSGLPEFEFVPEVVAEQAERHVCPARDLAGRGPIEALFGESLLCRVEDALADFDRTVRGSADCSHEQDYCTAE